MLKEDLSPTISRKAIIQSIVSIGSLFLIHMFLGAGSMVPGLIVYCYWFLTGTIASLYGPLEGLFAAVLCSISFIFVQSIYASDYYTSFWEYLGQPFIWAFTALLFGEIRAQTNQTLLQAQDHLKANVDNNTKLQQHLLEAQKEIRNLQQSIVQTNEIIENIISSLSSLLTLKPTQLLLNVENTIIDILGPKKFSIYGKGNNGFEVLVSHGWKKEETYPLRIVSTDPLFEQVVVHREVVTSTNPAHKELLQPHGVFAAPLFNPETLEVFGLFKIEEAGDHPLDSSFVGIAEGLTKFIGLSYTLVKQYQEALKNSIYARGIYSYAFYERIHPYLLHLAQKIGFPLVYFHIVLRPSSENVFHKELRILGDIVRRTLPDQTLYFLGKEPANEIIALLPASAPRKLEAFEHQLSTALQNSTELQASKIFVTRKVEYIPENESIMNPP